MLSAIVQLYSNHFPGFFEAKDSLIGFSACSYRHLYDIGVDRADRDLMAFSHLQLTITATRTGPPSRVDAGSLGRSTMGPTDAGVTNDA